MFVTMKNTNTNDKRKINTYHKTSKIDEEIKKLKLIESNAGLITGIDSDRCDLLTCSF